MQLVYYIKTITTGVQPQLKCKNRMCLPWNTKRIFPNTNSMWTLRSPNHVQFLGDYWSFI